MSVNSPLEPILERVRSRVSAYFPDVGREVRIRVVGVSRRPYSEVYRVAIVNGRKPEREVFIKVSQEAEVQFRAMKTVWPHFASHPTWKIARPLDWFETGPALVTEGVPGVPLDRRLPCVAWLGRWLRQGEADCRRAGQWLRFYHDLGKTEESGVPDLRAKWDGLEESLHALRESGFKPKVFCAFLDRLRPLAERLKDQPRAVSHVHGEFKAEHVLIHESGVTALDLSALDRNIVEHDIASFLNSLLLMRLTRPVPWSALGRLRDAFLGGYYGRRQHDESAITFLQGIGLADVSLDILGRRRSTIARAWLQHVLGGAARMLMG